MNTPKPCDTCDNLYYNSLYKDDPFYVAECRLGKNIIIESEGCNEYIPIDGKPHLIIRKGTK